ncbi:J domain-containing protein [Actibacterium pelagium]|uniref:Molecular chaperone DnaJ n=1 Tax=Actibacterium pelagium TaxID=2029103 RepID=A0A917AFJ5_9RHOB|nr:J domain-containing protein [Actibacterium pelagium]GGE47151.1 molecular chaperone DnaJ [Actibacterium pelagium]
MSKSDPFGFDISVSASKKKNPRGRRGMSGAFETSKRKCEHEGCTEAGQYRAPRSPDHLDEYLWFCKDHVREYNLKWNFFNGATEEEMNAQADKDRVWERETKPFKKTAEQQAWARLGIDDAHQVLGDNATRNPGKSITGTRRLPPTERKALEILDAKDHWTKKEIRKQYKSLIKDLHPDMNGGNRSDEDRLQEVVWAWDQIKDSRSFQT